MLTKTRYREMPPRVDYELTDRGRDALSVVAAVARWGHKWTWDAPDDVETLDPDALDRVASAMAAGAEQELAAVVASEAEMLRP